MPELDFLENHVQLAILSCNNLNAGWSGRSFPGRPDCELNHLNDFSRFDRRDTSDRFTGTTA